MLQSLYTTAVVHQIVEDRIQTAARARRSARGRRLFGRRERRAGAPLPTSPRPPRFA